MEAAAARCAREKVEEAAAGAVAATKQAAVAEICSYEMGCGGTCVLVWRRGAQGARSSGGRTWRRGSALKAEPGGAACFSVSPVRKRIFEKQFYKLARHWARDWRALALTHTRIGGQKLWFRLGGLFRFFCAGPGRKRVTSKGLDSY